MAKKMTNKQKKTEFSDKGVEFTFPPELAHVEVYVGPKPDPWYRGGPPQEGFVINFILHPLGAKEIAAINEFGFDLEVKYKYRKDLQIEYLGIYTEKGWQKKYEGNPGVDTYKIVDSESDHSWAGSYKVKIKDITSDPVVGWGP